MKKFFICLAMALLFSCENDETTIEYVDVKEQDWYQELAIPCDESDICLTRINKALYNNDTVYFTALAGALCDPVFSATLLNIEGEVVKEYNLDNVSDFYDEVTFIETIFKCEED